MTLGYLTLTERGMRHKTAAYFRRFKKISCSLSTKGVAFAGGTDIKLIQELLGHNDITTTLRYTHVSKRTLEGIKSPFDALRLKDGE